LFILDLRLQILDWIGDFRIWILLASCTLCSLCEDCWETGFVEFQEVPSVGEL